MNQDSYISTRKELVLFERETVCDPSELKKIIKCCQANGLLKKCSKITSVTWNKVH